MDMIEESYVDDIEMDDDVIGIGARQSTSGLSPPIDGISLSGTLKRGLKVPNKDQSDTISLSGALKRGLRKHGLKSEVSPYETSSRNSKRFSFKTAKKGKNNGEDTMSLAGRRDRGSRSLKLRDVVSSSILYDDTVSVIDGMIINTAPIRQQEGIRDTIGRKNVVTLKKMIKLDRPQGDRTDAKVLVLTPYRCQILGVKQPFKMEANFHFLEIKAMDSPSPERLVISTTDAKIYFMQMIGTDDADHIIGRVALSLRTIFPGVALSRILKASLEPLGRQKVIQTMLNQADQHEPGPCGNFSAMYCCVCDYLNCPVREDVEWDVDTIYLSQNCHEINLKDFDLPETRDIIPIILLMTYNKWFEGLVAKGMKLPSEVLDFILKVVRNSHNLKELTLEGVGLKGDFAQKLANNIVENKESGIRVLNLSSNNLEDKGLLHLSGALPTIKHGSITHLNVAKTGLSAKGVTGLCQSLRSSSNIMKTLTSLNLSGNPIKTDDAEGLYNFLSSENNLTELDLSSTECAIEMYISAMAKGCKMHLQKISLSKNHFYGKTSDHKYPSYLEEDYSLIRRNKDLSIPASFKEFFQNTEALQFLDLSQIKIPSEALKCMLEGLQNNNNRSVQVSLNLACCELKQTGSQVLQGHIGTIRNIVSLDLTENSIDNEMIPLLSWIQQNRSLKELSIGKNFSGIKQKDMKRVMDSFVELVQEEDSALEILSLADSKCREYLQVLLGCLGSNTSLTSLDISGNGIYDTGARKLAKSIQINSKLRILKLDRNYFTSYGFHEIANALEKNYTLRYMPYPVNDAIAAMKHNPERAQTSLARIQDLLLRNANANRGSNDQQFRLQKVLTCTAQQVLDEVSEKVDNTVNALEIIDGESSTNLDVITAKKLVKDANNSKELLSDIYGLGMEKSAGENSQLQSKINEMASKMDAMVQQHVESTISTMAKNAEAACPHIFEEINDYILSLVNEKCQLPKDCVKEHVVQNSGTEIVNKVSELNLAIATLISDKVTDKLLAALSQCNLSLTEQLNKHKKQPSSTSATNDSSAQDAGDDPEGYLPTMRRERAASVAKRKLRPTTEVDGKSADARLGELPALPPSDDDEITEFAVVADPYHNERVKERKKAMREIAEENDEKKADGVEGEKGEKKEKIETQEKKEEPEKVKEKEKTTDDVDGKTPVDDVMSQLVEPAQEKLEHITKGRPRGPMTRRVRRPPAKAQRSTQEDVNDFFTTNVSNTDFSATPGREEEEKMKIKERLEVKKPKRTPGGMGGMLLTPDMLKKKSHEATSPNDDVKNNGTDEDEVKEEAKEERPKRPKGAMIHPGMGFGGNLLAEMKLKKLNKKAADSPFEEVKSPGKTPDGETPGFGPGMLKKSVKSPAKQQDSNNNSNNNNNNNSKSSFLSRLGKNLSPDSKTKPEPSKNKPLMPPKTALKGKPPPLPTKPKPTLIKSDQGKQRPFSEFIEPMPKTKSTSSALVRDRAASWGKTRDKRDEN